MEPSTSASESAPKPAASSRWAHLAQEEEDKKKKKREKKAAIIEHPKAEEELLEAQNPPQQLPPPGTPTGGDVDTPPHESEQNLRNKALAEVLGSSSTSALPQHFSVTNISCRSVDEFEKLNKIQEGAYGVVYRARNKATGEIVALKKFKLEKEKEGFPITALREIRTLMEHKHPNIVDLKEIVVNDHGSIFMVMEFLEHDLKDLTDQMKSPFITSEIKCLMLQLLAGVDHLHSNFIIHRDLKTSNLLMNNRGVLKVADFGLARTYGSPLKPYTPVVVTLWYRAPELLLNTKKYDAAIDIWSVGCIFAELLNKGEPIFQGRGEFNQLQQIFQTLGTPNEKIWPGYSELPGAKSFTFANYQPYMNLKKKLPHITEKCFDLLLQMLTYDPKRRITAAQALQHPYFSEPPRAQSCDLMPTFPSAHEGIAVVNRKRPASVDAEEQQKRAAANEANDEARYQGARDRDYFEGFHI